jgi:hypothetical protein
MPRTTKRIELGAKPKVFVGSASEAKKIAQAFCDALKDEASVVPWWLSPEFRNGFSTLEGLIRAVQEYDFAVFILTPVDQVESRGQKGWSARDNVLFEYGLFLGCLGRDRTFIFVQKPAEKGKEVKIPSDLGGMYIPRFSEGNQHDLIASVNTALSESRTRIHTKGRRAPRVKFVSSWGFDLKSSTFSMTLSAVPLSQNKELLEGKKFVLVGRKNDDDVNAEDDSRLAIGAARRPSEISGDMTLRVSDRKVFGKAAPEDVAVGYLMLFPNGLEPSDYRTISEMKTYGADLIEAKGRKMMP